MSTFRRTAFLVIVSIVAGAVGGLQSPARAIEPQGVQPIGRGDLQCDGSLNAKDSLNLVLFLAGDPAGHHPACRDIGEVTYTKNGRIAFERDGDIWAMNADGTDPQQITDDAAFDYDPQWSPTGDRLAFARYNGLDDDIWVMNSDGAEQMAVADGPNAETRPRWSPDGTMIGFTVYDGEQSDVWVMDANGSNKTNLTTDNPTDPDAIGDWSPDGMSILFSSRRNGGDESDFYSMDAGGANVTPLGVSGYSPDWSPDGTLILFYQGFGAGNWDLTVMAAGGGPVTVLTEDPEFDGAPEWSPDGKRITFTSRRDDGDHEVYVMEADGSGETRLTDRVGGDTAPSWEPLPETWGDLNCDGMVNADDLMISLKHAARVPYELPKQCGPLVG